MHRPFALLAAALLAAPASAQVSPETIKAKISPGSDCYVGDNVVPPRPRIWRIADADTTIYLFGTVHVFAAETCWQDHRLTDIVRAADRLVTEVPGDASGMMSLAFLAEAGFDPANPPVRERLDPDVVPLFERFLEEDATGWPESFYDKLDSWAIAEFIGETVGEEEVGPTSGAESELELQFELLGKERDALETVEYQVKMSDRYSPELQRQWLNAVLRDLASQWRAEDAGDAVVDERWNRLFENWRTGRPIELDTYVAHEMRLLSSDPSVREELVEEYLEVLLYERNRNWVDWLERRLDTPGTDLVAVGAGHLDGERSVIDYARRRGLPVTLVE